MKLAEALLHALKDRGATEIFGIPGDFALPLFKVIEESGVLPLYTLSHEPGVGFAADVAARANRALGVAVVTYGAGGLNIVNATAGALAEKSPLVVVSGAPGVAEREGGLLLHHQVKTVEALFRVYREVTCDQVVLDDAESAPREIARVLQSCRERSQPVYIEVPRDMVSVECARVGPGVPSPFDRDAVAACAGEIIERLRSARSPVLVVGVEIRRYGIEREVAELARKLELPVVTSFMGRGLLTDADVPLMGTYLGVAGEPAITRLVEESDALLLLGVILSDSNLASSSRRIDLRGTIQALDRRVTLGFHTYAPVPLEALVEALLQRALTSEKPERPRQPMQPVAYPRGLQADEAPVTPTDLACAVNDMMDRHGPMPIAADVGDCMFTAMHIEHTHLTAPGYYASMGYGVPAGLGLQVATGDRPLILVGDGAFQMTGWELGNCRRYGWDPIVIVFNNRGWEMMRAFEPESRFNDLDDWHFAEVARILGGEGERVTTRRELHCALERAVTTRGRFFLIEAMLERGAMSETLARYVAGAKRGRSGG
jgi:indolepyruvate decarboxylase